MAGVSRSAKTFTPKQGQYLAFIHSTRASTGGLLPKPTCKHYFGVTPPSVHQMVVTLEQAGFIRRQPRVARSIEVLVDPQLLPQLL